MNCSDDLGVVLGFAGVTVILVRFGVPVPVNLTICGLGPPSSFMLRVAVRAPKEVGVNVVTSPQLAPGLTVSPQELDWIANSVGFVPPKIIPPRLRIVVALRLVIVKIRDGLVWFRGEFPNPKPDGVNLIEVAIPVNVITVGLLISESFIVSVAVLAPAVVGLKVV